MVRYFAHVAVAVLSCRASALVNLQPSLGNSHSVAGLVKSSAKPCCVEVANEVYSPKEPFLELADAGTTCNRTLNCGTGLKCCSVEGSPAVCTGRKVSSQDSAALLVSSEERVHESSRASTAGKTVESRTPCPTWSPPSPAPTCAPQGQTFSGSVDVDATSSGSAAKGTYEREGVTYTTSDEAQRSEDEHAKSYNGPTEFTATYSIKVDATGKVDTKNSAVTFKTTSYTANGNKESSNFVTNKITVTSVTLSKDCPPKLEGFSFESKDWYPATAAGADGLRDRTLSGSIDLVKKTASYDAKYTVKVNGAVYTYKVEGKIK